MRARTFAIWGTDQGLQAPLTAAVRCAGTQGLLLPLMQNASCMAKANKLLDVAGQDVSRDGRASAVYNFSTLCYDAMAANITGLIVSELGW